MATFGGDDQTSLRLVSFALRLNRIALLTRLILIQVRLGKGGEQIAPGEFLGIGCYATRTVEFQHNTPRTPDCHSAGNSSLLSVSF
jgi:hypothetical protein